MSATLGGAPPFTALATPDGARSAGDSPVRGAIRTKRAGWIVERGRGYVAVQTPSSFDWHEQGILYVAKDLPDPTRARDAWMEEAGDRSCELVNAAGGRALVLCTSHANVKRFAEVLRERTDHRILAQGDRDSGRLTQEFVEDETSVLVGTRSFWAGIDAAGAACVLVVIDKIPFPVPDEPLHAARRTPRRAAGVDAFVAVDLPVAAFVLAQGAGRLLRRRRSWCRRRARSAAGRRRGYREQLLAAMPPLRRSVDLAEACGLLRSSPRGPRPRSSVGVGRASTRRPAAHRPVERRDPSRSAISSRATCATPRSPNVAATTNGTSAFLHEGRVRAATV